MPQYQYKCTNPDCDNETTIDCKMSQYSPTIQCTKCDEPMTRKVENLIAGYQCNVQGFYGKVSK